MPMISAADPASKATQTFPSMEELGSAILDRGFIPIRPDGTVYITQKFEGGLLLDGAPLNVYYRNGWYPEQRELLADHWGKDVPAPPADILNLPLITDATAQQALASYHEWKTNVGTIAGIPTTWVLIGGAAVALYFLWGRD